MKLSVRFEGMACVGERETLGLRKLLNMMLSSSRSRPFFSTPSFQFLTALIFIDILACLPFTSANVGRPADRCDKFKFLHTEHRTFFRKDLFLFAKKKAYILYNKEKSMLSGRICLLGHLIWVIYICSCNTVISGGRSEKWVLG